MNSENKKGLRVVGGSENIDYQNVSDFFDKRSQDDNKKHKYNYVMYLDNAPDVAISRDWQSKQKIKSLLNIKPGMRVLDVGCGIGRWGEMFCPQGVYYVGIDGCSKMIDRAEENLADYKNKKLLVGAVQNLTNVLEEAHENEPFDLIILVGVLMYINDQDVLKLLSELVNFSGSQTQICLVESMSDEQRLTLKDIYSEELNQYYSAIYRSTSEFLSMMESCFGSKFTLKTHELMDFSDGLQKKREHVTMEHCVIWQSLT